MPRPPTCATTRMLPARRCEPDAVLRVPVLSASGTVVKEELKYECVTQPRSHGPQKWQGPRPLMGFVRFAERASVTVRPNLTLTLSRKICS